MNRFNDNELKSEVLKQVEENLRRAFPIPDKKVPQEMEELLRQLEEVAARK